MKNKNNSELLMLGDGFMGVHCTSSLFTCESFHNKNFLNYLISSIQFLSCIICLGQNLNKTFILKLVIRSFGLS